MYQFARNIYLKCAFILNAYIQVSYLKKISFQVYCILYGKSREMERYVECALHVRNNGMSNGNE